MKIIDIPQSGKAGLYVSYKGRNGQVRRAWVVPTNPRTVAQLNVRAKLTSVAQRFRTLTSDQINAWDNAARKYQTQSRLGQNGPLTGFQFFTKINATLARFGQDQVDSPPGPPNLPAVAPSALVITNDEGVIALTLTCAGNPGENTIVWASSPQSAGVRAMPQTRVLGTCPAPVNQACDITALYTAKYGAPSVGDQIFVELNTFADGWQGPKLAFSALVPEAA